MPTSLKVLVLPLDINDMPERRLVRLQATLQKVLRPDDRWELGDTERLTDSNGWDLLIIWEPCGWTPLAKAASESRIPCMPLTPQLVFHPYFAAFLRETEERGGVLLPADNPATIGASIQAVRVAKSLSELRLLVVDNHENDARAEQVSNFSKLCRSKWGLAIERLPVSLLRSIAAEQSDVDVNAEWSRWLDEYFVDAGEMNVEHMRQVVRLYLAERHLLRERSAQGITVDDIGAFYFDPSKPVMPNVSYTPLVCEGFLCCEEGDIEVLTTEAILRSGLGAPPTMSNIYMAYRDAMDSLEHGQFYAPDLERRDALQCIADNHVVAAHFSTSGVLPRNMMEEEKYRIRETLPSWPGQSMTASTPRMGPVVLARLSADLSAIHLVSGVVDDRRMDDRRGWYRGRWMIRIPSTKSFTRNCLHQHYAIGPENGNSALLDILTQNVLGLRRTDVLSFPVHP